MELELQSSQSQDRQWKGPNGSRAKSVKNKCLSLWLSPFHLSWFIVSVYLINWHILTLYLPCFSNYYEKGCSNKLSYPEINRDVFVFLNCVVLQLWTWCHSATLFSLVFLSIIINEWCLSVPKLYFKGKIK